AAYQRCRQGPRGAPLLSSRPYERFSTAFLQRHPGDRPLLRAHRKADLAVDAVARGVDQLRVLLALPPQRADGLGARVELHDQRLRLHARLRLRAAQGRARAHRHAVGEVLRAQERHHRPRLVPAAFLPDARHPDGDQRRRCFLFVLDRGGIRADGLASGDVAVPCLGAARRGSPHGPGRVGIAEVLLPDPLRPRVRAPGKNRGMNFIELLGMVMLVVMLFAIFVGIPISFTLLFLALIFGFIGLGSTVFDLAYLQTIGLMKQDEFVAVPMFILMGYICDQAGLMERLFRGFRDLFAPLSGSLYLVVIATATLFGIAAGTVGATVALLGIMAGPMMIKSGYDVRMSAGAITAGGTLGILIPPSVMLVVMGPVLGVSIIDLYAAAFGPGFLLAGMYMVYTMVRSHLNPKLGPPVPKEERVHSIGTILWECVVGMVPVTVLTIATLGVILAGITTSTEAAAMGAAGAIALVLGYGRFTWRGLFSACQSTLATTSMVLFLAVASNVFGAVFARLGTATWITNTLLAVPLPAWGTIS